MFLPSSRASLTVEEVVWCELHLEGVRGGQVALGRYTTLAGLPATPAAPLTTLTTDGHLTYTHAHTHMCIYIKRPSPKVTTFNYN